MVKRAYLCQKYVAMSTELAPRPTLPSVLKIKFNNGSPLRLYADGMSRDEFYEFCLANPELRIERTADGRLLIMPPTASETGNHNAEITIEIGLWNRQYKLGRTFRFFHRLYTLQWCRTCAGYCLDSSRPLGCPVCLGKEKICPYHA